MKQQLLLTLLFATTQLFSQTPVHFLITSDQQINISEPLCEDMIKETTQLFELTLKRTEKGLKKGLEITLAQSARLEVFKNTGRNPRKEVPLHSLGSNLVQVFSMNALSEIYLSTNKISLAALGPASVEISLSNITVSPSQTSMDVTVKNPATNTAPIRTHLSLATGILLQDMEGQPEARWYFFWNAFFERTAIIEWLETTITSVNSAVISPEKSLELLQAPIKNSKFLSAKHLEQAKTDAQRILKEVPYPIPFDQIQGILISQDETKLIFKTISTELHTWNEERYITENEWFFSKKNDDWLLVQANSDIRSIENEEDSNKWKINFYRMAFDLQQNPKIYKEDKWTKIVDQIIDNYRTIEFKHVIYSEVNHQIIEKHINPQLAKLLKQDNYAYNNFYQRQSAEFGDYSLEDNTIYTTTDFLISNPEQTAFIYPVLLHHKKEQERDYYYTNEDFKFYVLLKNEQGTFDLYDWHYFKTIPYKNYYNLTNCVESHLVNIMEYIAGQEVVGDTNFWNNFVLKPSARGYDYLIPVVAREESIHISKNQFDAQVTDCIKLIQEHDISELYPNQLKQIIRCVNTIEKWNLQSITNDELHKLSKELHLQKRINNVQENSKGFYPKLNLEFETNLNPHSYYIIE